MKIFIILTAVSLWFPFYIFFAKTVSSFWDVEVLDSADEKFIRIAYTAVDPFYY